MINQSYNEGERSEETNDNIQEDTDNDISELTANEGERSKDINCTNDDIGNNNGQPGINAYNTYDIYNGNTENEEVSSGINEQEPVEIEIQADDTQQRRYNL